MGFKIFLTIAPLAHLLSAYHFNVLNHQGGNAPYFESYDPPADPSPPQGCSVTRAAYLAHHGAIYASGQEYTSILAPFFKKLANNSVDWAQTSPSLAFLATWTPPIAADQVENLTRSGKLEANEFGVRLSYRYPNLPLPQQVWASSSDKTMQSAQSIILGLEPEPNQINLVSVQENKLAGANTLTPQSSCPAYSTNSGSTQAEQFAETYIPSILTRLNAEALAFNFTSADVLAMQTLCAYETVIRGHSDFCSLNLFSADEWLAFEYANDILDFYSMGYGTTVPGHIGYPWFNATAELLTTDPAPAQSLYISVTHRELLPMVATAMGLFNNSAFGSGNINDTMPTDLINHRRAFKTSIIFPLLGHVAIERLQCSSSYGYSKVIQQNKGVFYRTLWNGAPQQLPGCVDGPGESCSAQGFQNYAQQRQAMFDGYLQACQVNYTGGSDVLSIYGEPNNGTSVGR